jgi:HD-like signal output (HDOD) protein
MTGEQGDVFHLIEKIDRVMAGKIRMDTLGDAVFETLDNVNASRKSIEAIQSMISNDILARLFSFANSSYLGSLRHGKASNFFDVVSRLGLSRTKTLVVTLASYHQCQNDPDIELIFAKSYATSIMAQILAGQAGFRDEAIKKAELSGLFLEIGKKTMLLYKKIYADERERLDDEFIDAYHPYLGEMIVRRYGLPDYLKTVILARMVIMEENQISLIGIVRMAHDMVETSFRKYQNRLVVKCQTPRPATDVTRTLEAIMMDRFKAVGLEKYLHIIRIPRIYDI